jgi:4-deoxy-L-threo-5-hexosulose-uronate ketol-isomerase
MRYLPTAEEALRLGGDELRRRFVVSGLFEPGEARFELVDLDRVVVGGVVPAERAIPLAAPELLGAAAFTERRELGILNIGAAGRVTVDGTSYALARTDLLYVGRGMHDVTFASDSADDPARFYLVSYLAHAQHATVLVRASEAESAELGSTAEANRRRLARYVHANGAPSAQLVMGVTALHEGSVWNTMPPHTHVRRSELYLYFGLPAHGVVIHLMGRPDATQHLVIRDNEVVLSPSWSIHAGCGTSSYSFCWAMGGENQNFADMQRVDPAALR